MSLSIRISIIMLLVLTVGLVGAGIALVRIVKQSQQYEIDGRLNARLAWLVSAIDMEAGDGKICMEAHGLPAGMSDDWQIRTKDGRILWSSRDSLQMKHVATKSQVILLGEEGWPELSGEVLKKIYESDKDEKNKSVAYKFLPVKSSITLVVSSFESTVEKHIELERLYDKLIVGIPSVILILGILLIILVRWQLRPLSRMAAEAGCITPDNLGYRISDAGTSSECICLRAAINEMVKRLADGIERERLFFQAASHDLRTPLAQMRLQAEITLRKTKTPQQYQDAFREMIDDIIKLEQLIKGLLLLTRTSYLKADSQHVVCLYEVVHEICPEVQVPESIMIAGESNLIYSAIINVVENAKQYAPDKAPEVTFRDMGEFVELIISDFGSGIPEGDLERIFEPLVRLDSARTSNATTGFGLGLAITRSITRTFLGEITCGNRNDGISGAVFTFKFKKV